MQATVLTRLSPARTARVLTGALLCTAALAVQALPLNLAASASSWQAITPASSFNNSCYPCTSSINTVGTAWEAANTGWNSSATYNTSGWSSYAGGWGNNSGITPFYARTVFTIGTPVSGSFTIWADDDVHAWLNGVKIVNDTDFTAGTGNITVNLLPYLLAGDNVLAFKAHNSAGGGYGASFSGSIEAAAPAPASFSTLANPVPEPTGLALLGLALAAAGACRRQRRA